VIAATTVVLALAVITPSVSADSAKAFHLTKTCASDVNQPAGPVLAKCTFGSGSGRLTQFHLAVDVTFDGTTWFWDGQYWFGG